MFFIITAEWRTDLRFFGVEMRFGQKIKLMREQRGWAPEILGLKAGVSRATVYNIEAMKWHWEAKPQTIDHLSNAFRMPAKILLSICGGEVELENGEHDRRLAERDYKDIDPPYDPPPPYEPNEEDRVPSPAMRGSPRKGIAGIADILPWFRELPLNDRGAVLATLVNEMTLSSGAVQAAALSVVQDVKQRQASRKAPRRRKVV